MIRTQDIMRCLPLLASILGRQYGVQVHIGGDGAYTDGKTIHLPAMPLISNNEYISMVRGFLDHESGHIRETDFKALAQRQLTPFQKNIFNAIEDWRIENIMGKRYAGCEQNFKYLIKKIFVDEAQEEQTQPSAFCILNYILLTVRSWAVPEVLTRKTCKADLIDRHYCGLRSALDALLAQVQQHCPDTAAALQYAITLSSTIEQWAKQNTQEQSPQTKSVTENQGQDSTPAPTKMGNIGDKNKQGLGGQTGQINKVHELTTLLQAVDDELPQSISEAVAKKIESIGSSGAQAIEVARVGTKNHSALSAEKMHEVMRETASLGIHLRALLQGHSLQPCIQGRSGKLDTAHLYKWATHNPRIFYRKGEKLTLNTALHILFDTSASMRLDDAISLASKACYGVAHSLSKIQGINVGVSAFPVDNKDVKNGVLPLVKHGEPIHNHFLVEARGTTPMAEALWWVMQQMLPLQETRKIILIITDGEPDNIADTKAALLQAHNLGMETYGIGIKSDSITRLLPIQSRSVKSLTELAPAMFGLLQNALRRVLA